MTKIHLMSIGLALAAALRFPVGCAKVTVEPGSADAGESGVSGGTSNSSASAGAPSSGGTTNGSSTSATGGNAAKGGTTATSAPGTGGATVAPGTGGTPATGGLPGTGGAPATGGAPPVVMPYTNDFEATNALAGWQRVDNGAISTSNWTVVEETAGATNHVFLLGTIGSSDTYEVGGNSIWTDQAIEVKVKPMSSSTSGYVYLAARYAAVKTYYFLQMQLGSKPKIRARVDGSTNDVCAGTTAVDATSATGVWATLGLSVKGSTLTATLNGTVICTGSNADIAAGGIALGGKGIEVQFDDLSVTLPP